MPDPTARIDHVLVNVNDRLDAAVSRYEAMGFTLTPRGHHSVGSSNNLAIFGDDYFELLGYEPRNAARASSLWGDRTGFTGLIFKADDADALNATLRARGIARMSDEPVSLSRPVELPGGETREARFATLHLDPATTPGGRIFFCRHLTPELVWRSEWQIHANGVTGIAGVTVATADPVASIHLLERIFGSAAIARIDGGVRLTAGPSFVDYLTPAAARAAFGDDIGLDPAGADRKVAVTLRTASRAAARAALERGGVPFSTRADGALLVPAPEAFGPALAFVE